MLASRGSLHFLQSGKHGARVLDEYSARTTTTRLWGRVSGRPLQTDVVPELPPHRRKEAVVARRVRPGLPTLEVRVTCEPSRVSSAWIVQAYEQVVPLRRRPLAPGASSRLEQGAPQTQRVGGDTDHELYPSGDLCPGFVRATSRAQTVASQVAALRERVAAEGLALPEAMQFIDEGYSGATRSGPPWSGCGMSLQPEPSIGSPSIPRIGSHGNMPIRSCSSMRSSGPASRCASSTGTWGGTPKMICCSKSKG